jgi:tripartite-type tricarboxylate transporter receptor subunit TctC
VIARTLALMTINLERLMMKRFGLRTLLGISAVCSILSGPVFAQAYPSQPIKLVVPWPPGGLTDAIGRTIGHSLSERLGQSVIVENKPGASGNIGTAQFARTKPDGYTLLLGSSTTNAANPHLYSQLGFDPLKDFAPVGLIASAPNVFLVAANSPYKNVQQVIAAAKAKPKKLTYGSAGSASSAHLAGALFTRMTDAEMMHVPYKGAGPALVDLMAGHIDLMLDPSALQHIKSGKLRALAVPSKTRLPALPDVPTFEEATGMKNMYAYAWYGLMAPAGTPTDIVNRLNRELNAVLQTPEIRTRLIEAGAEIGGGTVEEFGRFMASELERYGDIVKISGAKVD